MSDNVVVGLDIGGTNLRMGAVDSNFALTEFGVTSSRATLAGSESAAALVEHVATFFDATGVKPKAIVIGFPSTIDVTRRIVLSASNIPGLDRLPFADLVEDAIGVPTYLERDTNLLLVHDMWCLGLRDERVVVGCYPGTGFGSALSIGGRLHLGKTGSEGELGHIPVKGLELRCGCGNIGCIEAIASGKYLETLLAKHFPGTPIGEVFVRHGGNAVLEDFVDSLSIPIASAINILDPHAVIVGGGVIAMDGFPRDLLVKRVRDRTRKPEPEASLRLVFAEPRQENGVIGAGIYGFQQILGRTS